MDQSFYTNHWWSMEQPLKKKIKHICLKCDKVFNRAQRLKDHQSKKSCGTVCTQCNHKFPHRRRLEQHQKNASIIDCSICEKRFCHQADYNNHQRTIHQLNPLQCSTCSKEFSTRQRLEDHKKNPISQDCDLCDQKFCHQADYNKHKILEHIGGAVDNSVDEEYESILKQQIFAANVELDNDEEYQNIVQINKSHIEDKVVDRKMYMNVNKELTTDFTYKDLEDLIVHAVEKHKTVMKFNIGFGIVLKNVLTSEYRYYYVSTNHMLFNRAKTISTLSAVKNIIKEIYDMNITEHYYMVRPSSGWSLVKITNVFFKLFNLYLPLG